MVELMNIGILYAAMVVSVYWHELGHQGKKIVITKWFPWVEGYSKQARYRYGGLLLNLLAALTIFYYTPQTSFLLLFGFMNWLTFVLYTILGSFNKEPTERYIRNHQSMISKFVFDDIENRYWLLSVSAGVIVYVLMKNYYLGVFTRLIIGG